MATQTSYPVQTLVCPGSLARRFLWRLEHRDALGIMLVVSMVSLVGWLYLTQANVTAATNLRIEETRAQLKRIQQDTARLQVEIAEWESLPRIEERARSMGLRPATSSLYLSVPGYSIQEATTWEASRVDITP